MGKNKWTETKELLHEQMGRDQGSLGVIFRGTESPQTNSASAYFSLEALENLTQTSLKNERRLFIGSRN